MVSTFVGHRVEAVGVNRRQRNDTGGKAMAWTKPAYQELRLGFEINMYVTAR